MKIGGYEQRVNICGKNIQTIREERHMTQEQLAAHLQLQGIVINQNCISRIERGKRIITDYELKYIAIALKTAVDILLQEQVDC